MGEMCAVTADRAVDRTHTNQGGQQMTFGIAFHMRLGFPSVDEFEAWREQILIEQRARLEPLPRFSERFDPFDEDLLTDLVVEGASTLEEALDELRQVGHEITADDIREWRPAVDDEGNPGVHLLEARKLGRDSRVAALLDHLRVNPSPSLLRVHGVSLHDHADIVASGAFRDYDTYCEYRLPLIFAGTSAKEFGGAGHVSFFGVEDMEPVALFVDFHPGAVEMHEPDAQDVAVRSLHERLAGTVRGVGHTASYELGDRTRLRLDPHLAALAPHGGERVHPDADTRSEPAGGAACDGGGAARHRGGHGRADRGE